MAKRDYQHEKNIAKSMFHFTSVCNSTFSRKRVNSTNESIEHTGPKQFRHFQTNGQRRQTLGRDC